jgi:hypothetical protein
MDENDKPEFEYIATDKRCGCVVGLMADYGDPKETAAEVARFIKHGCAVTRVSRESEEFRHALDNFGHRCEFGMEQLRLI